MKQIKNIKWLLVFSFCWISYTSSAQQDKLFPNDPYMQWMYEQLGQKKSKVLKNSLEERGKSILNASHRKKERYNSVSESLVKESNYYYFYGGTHLPTYYLFFNKQGYCVAVTKLLGLQTHHTDYREGIHKRHQEAMKKNQDFWGKNTALFTQQLNLSEGSDEVRQPLELKQLAKGNTVLAVQNLQHREQVKGYLVSVSVNNHIDKLAFEGQVQYGYDKKAQLIPAGIHSFDAYWQQYLATEFNNGKMIYRGGLDKDGKRTDSKAFIGVFRKDKWYYGYAAFAANEIVSSTTIALYETRACTGTPLFIGEVSVSSIDKDKLLLGKGFLLRSKGKEKSRWGWGYGMSYNNWKVNANFDENMELHGEVTYEMSYQNIDLVYEHGQLKTDLSDVILYGNDEDKAGSISYKGAVNTKFQAHGKGVKYVKRGNTFAKVIGEWANGYRKKGTDLLIVDQLGKYQVSYKLSEEATFKHVFSDKIIISALEGMTGDKIETTFYEQYPEKPLYKTVGSYKKDFPIGTHQLAKYQSGKWTPQSPIVCGADIQYFRGRHYAYLISGLNLYQLTSASTHQENEKMKAEQAIRVAQADAKKEAERKKREAEEAKQKAKEAAEKALLDKVKARMYSFYCDYVDCRNKTVIYNGAVSKKSGSGQSTGSHHLFFVNGGPACTLKVNVKFMQGGMFGKVEAEQTYTIHLADGSSGLQSHNLELLVQGGSYTRYLDVEISGFHPNKPLRVVSVYHGKLIDKKQKDAMNDIFRHK